MKYFKKIVGEKVYLSPMSVEDAEIYTKWMNDFSISDNTGSSSRVFTVEGEKEWITNMKGQYQFAVIRLKDEALLGNCGIENINFINRCAEVGIFLGEEENRNQGYGTEALQLLVKYGFEYLNLNNIMLRVFAFNERAIQSYKKVGFQEMGKRRKLYYKSGTYYDEIYMDILQEEFIKNN